MPEFFDCASAKNFQRLMRDTGTFFGIPQDSNEAFAKFERMVNEKCSCELRKPLTFIGQLALLFVVVVELYLLVVVLFSI